MKKIISLALIFVMFFIFTGCGKKKADNSENKITNTQQNINNNSIKADNNVELIIDDGNNKSKYNYEVESMSAYDLLMKVARDNNFSIRATDTDFGKYIFDIGDKKGGEDGKFWNVYLNGKLSALAVDKIKLKTKDIVEFRYELSSAGVNQNLIGE